MSFNKVNTPVTSIANSSELCTISNDVNCNSWSNEQSRASSTFASRFLTAKQFECLYLDWSDKYKNYEQRFDIIPSESTTTLTTENKHGNNSLWELKPEQTKNYQNASNNEIGDETVCDEEQKLQEQKTYERSEIKFVKKEYYTEPANAQQESCEKCRCKKVYDKEYELTRAKKIAEEPCTHNINNKSHTNYNYLERKCLKGRSGNIKTNENNQKNLLYREYCPKKHNKKIYNKQISRNEKLKNCQCYCEKLEPVYNMHKCIDNFNGERHVINSVDKSKVVAVKPIRVGSTTAISKRFDSDTSTYMQAYNENNLCKPLLPSSSNLHKCVEMHNLQDVRGLQLQLRDKQREIESLQKCIQKYEVFAHSLRQEYLRNLQHDQHEIIIKKKINARRRKRIDGDNHDYDGDDDNVGDDYYDDSDSNQNVRTAMEHRILFLEAKLFNMYKELDQTRLSVRAERSRELEYQLRVCKHELELYRKASYDAGKCNHFNRLRVLHHQSVGQYHITIRNNEPKLIQNTHNNYDNVLHQWDASKENNTSYQTDISPSLLPSLHAVNIAKTVVEEEEETRDEEKDEKDTTNLKELRINKNGEATKELLEKLNDRDCFIETLKQLCEEQQTRLERTRQELEKTHIALEESEKSKTKLTDDIINLTKELSELRCLPRKVASMQCELLNLHGYVCAYRESLHDFSDVICKCNSQVSHVETEYKSDKLESTKNNIIIILEELKEIQCNLQLRWSEQSKKKLEMLDEEMEDKRAVIDRNSDEVKQLLDTLTVKLQMLQNNLHINPSLKATKKLESAPRSCIELHRTESANKESQSENENTLALQNKYETEEKPHVEVGEIEKTELNVETATFDADVCEKEKILIDSEHADEHSNDVLPDNKDYDNISISKKIIVQVQVADGAETTNNMKDLEMDVSENQHQHEQEQMLNEATYDIKSESESEHLQTLKIVQEESTMMETTTTTTTATTAAKATITSIPTVTSVTANTSFSSSSFSSLEQYTEKLEGSSKLSLPERTLELEKNGEAEKDYEYEEKIYSEPTIETESSTEIIAHPPTKEITRTEQNVLQPLPPPPPPEIATSPSAMSLEVKMNVDDLTEKQISKVEIPLIQTKDVEQCEAGVDDIDNNNNNNNDDDNDDNNNDDDNDDDDDIGNNHSNVKLERWKMEISLSSTDNITVSANKNDEKSNGNITTNDKSIGSDDWNDDDNNILMNINDRQEFDAQKEFLIDNTALDKKEEPTWKVDNVVNNCNCSKSGALQEHNTEENVNEFGEEEIDCTIESTSSKNNSQTEREEKVPCTLEEKKSTELEDEYRQEGQIIEETELEEEEQQQLLEQSNEDHNLHEINNISNNNNNNNNNNKDSKYNIINKNTSENESVVNTSVPTHISETENRLAVNKSKLSKRQWRRRQQKQRRKQRRREQRKEQVERNEKKQLLEEEAQQHEKEQVENYQEEKQELMQIREEEQKQQRQKHQGKKRGKQVLEQKLNVKGKAEKRQWEAECETAHSTALTSNVTSQSQHSEEHCCKIEEESQEQLSENVKQETTSTSANESAELNACVIDRKSDLTENASEYAQENEIDREQVSETLLLQTPEEKPFLVSRSPLLRSKLPDRYACNSADDDSFASYNNSFTNNEVNYKQRRNLDGSELDDLYKSKNSNIYNQNGGGDDDNDNYNDDDDDNGDDDDEKTTFSVHHINKLVNE